MCEKRCKDCNTKKPIEEFEPRGAGRRSNCRQCRSAYKSRHRKLTGRAPPVVEAMPIEVINSFALWFGPVDRARPLMPTP